MKKLFKKIFYYLRIIFFFLHFFFLFNITSTLLQIRPLIYLFLLLHFIFCINVIWEMLSKKKIYQEDFVYNLMQIGVYIYFFTIYYRVHYFNVFYMKDTVIYFNINFGILCFLLTFLIFYSNFELKNRKK